MKIPFSKADILLPENADMSKWAVIACDQYTSEPEYWEDVTKIVGDEPSTLKVTLPEIYLEEDNVAEKIAEVNEEMKKLINNNFFRTLKDSLIYVERTQADGRIRKGLMGKVDLEDYSFAKDSQTLIRATEGTVLERIPPRVKVRENAPLELPHIMLLIDDDKKEIIEGLTDKVSEEDKVYDTDLMKNGGHIKGYKLNDELIEKVLEGIGELADKEKFEQKYNVKDKGVLLFSVGDGNHSLATAKTCYENLKKTLTKEEYENHPARYALVEVVNLHSDALDFEPIHRVVFGVNPEHMMEELKKFYETSEEGEGQEKGLHFYDAAAPIIEKNSINMNIAFWGDRYKQERGKEETIEDWKKRIEQEQENNYINLPMNKEEYEIFCNELINAEIVELHNFEKKEIFEGCMPIEVMAKRGIDTLRFGPLKPVGFTDLRTGKRPYAIVQLRQDNTEGNLFNIVGFQTNLKFGEQKRVISLIPGLENAEFVKYGVMHRNTFINSPELLDNTYNLKKDPNIYFAGQITGVEGYVESIASGLVSGINACLNFKSGKIKCKAEFPSETVIGALANYISTSNKNFQPMNANFGILPELDEKIRDKKIRYEKMAQRSLKYYRSITNM